MPNTGIAGLLAESAGVVRQALLDVGVGLQAHLHQALDVLLTLRALHRGQERVPFGADLGVRRQARDVDQALDVGDGLLVEPGDAPGRASTKWSSSASGSARLT